MPNFMNLSPLISIKTRLAFLIHVSMDSILTLALIAVKIVMDDVSPAQKGSAIIVSNALLGNSKT